ncbi:MAG: Spx/MgsR family RNA polymerase-binding regulatory protein [Cyanobacteria bacterium P01_E01_bin.48]
MGLQVYGIPNCGTCKKAMAWLDNNDVTYEFVNTKEHPPTKEAIAAWIAALGAKPMRNTSGQSYRALGDERNDWDDAEWADAFARDAMLLKRPLFVKDGQAVLVGFRAAEETLRAVLCN